MLGILKHSEVRVQFIIINLADTSPVTTVPASDTTGKIHRNSENLKDYLTKNKIKSIYITRGGLVVS